MFLIMHTRKKATFVPGGVGGVGGAEKDTPLIGKCLHFCPPREARRRLGQRLIHALEVTPSAGPREGGIVAVKEYVRSGAGHTTPNPGDLRPPVVLVATINYLISYVSGRTDQPWWVVYEFVCNRIQSIRQDITYQQLNGPEVEYILQVAVRFHLYSQCRLWRAPINKFDPKLNRDQLQQCLLKLLKLSRQQNWIPEFETFYLLANLGKSEVIMHTLELDPYMRRRPRLAIALRINQSFLENNFVRCFRQIRELSPLEKAAVLPNISRLRRSALEILTKAYSSRNATFPISVLCSWLLLPDIKDMTNLCTENGIEVSGENILFRKGTLDTSDQVPKPGLNMDKFDGSIEPYRFILTPPPRDK